MAYAQDLGSCGLRPVWVRLPPGAREASSRHAGGALLLLLLAAEDAPLAALLLELGQDVRRRQVYYVLGFVEERVDLLALGLCLRRLGRVAEAAVLPPGVPAALLELRAVVGATPGRVRGQVEAAFPDRLPTRVGPTLVMAAVGPHRHDLNLPERPPDSMRPGATPSALSGQPVGRALEQVAAHRETALEHIARDGVAVANVQQRDALVGDDAQRPLGSVGGRRDRVDR